MTQENLQKALEALAGGGIAVAGDLVLEKHVEYEVGNVATGGIGIQIIHGTEADVEERVNEDGTAGKGSHAPQPLSASRKALSEKLKELARKGDWQSPASVERMEGLIDALMAEERFCGLLENGRGDRVRIVWQNLVGYFAERGFFPCGKGSPALNKMFFGARAEDYQNIDKGRKTTTMSEGFKAIVPLLERLLA